MNRNKITDEDRMNSKAMQLEEHVKRLNAELDEYIRVEEILVAAGAITKNRLEQAHSLVRDLKPG